MKEKRFSGAVTEDNSMFEIVCCFGKGKDALTVGSGVHPTLNEAVDGLAKVMKLGLNPEFKGAIKRGVAP